jgi:hypothetical protein
MIVQAKAITTNPTKALIKVERALLMRLGSPDLWPGVAPPAVTNIKPLTIIIITAPIPATTAMILAAVFIMSTVGLVVLPF